MPKIHNKKKGDGIYVTVRSKGVRSGHKHQLAHVLKKWCIVETYLIFYTLPHETYHVCSKIWNIYEKMLRRRGDLRSGAQALAHTGLHFVLGCQNRWDDFLSWDDFLFIRNSYVWLTRTNIRTNRTYSSSE